MTSAEMKKWMEQYLDSVFQYCCYLTGSRVEADDLCQDTFVTFMEKWPTLETRTERETRNYLLGIASNHWRNQRRKIWRRQKVSCDLADEDLAQISGNMNMEEDYERMEMIRAMQVAIRQLPDKQRIVINMSYSAEMTMDEIAAALHISRDTVKSRLRLAKGKLRTKMEEQGYEI